MSSSVLVNQCLAGPPRTDLCTRCVRCPVANILRALELTETVAYSAGLYSNKRITLHARGITPSLRARELTPHLRVLREYTPHPSAPRQSTPYPRSPFTGALRELTPHPGAESSPLTQARYDSHHSPVREREVSLRALREYTLTGTAEPVGGQRATLACCSRSHEAATGRPLWQPQAQGSGDSGHQSHACALRAGARGILDRGTPRAANRRL